VNETAVLLCAFSVEVLIPHNLQIDQEQVNIGRCLADILPRHMQGGFHSNVNLFVLQFFQKMGKAFRILQQRFTAAERHAAAGLEVIILVAQDNLQDVSNCIMHGGRGHRF